MTVARIAVCLSLVSCSAAPMATSSLAKVDSAPSASAVASVEPPPSKEAPPSDDKPTPPPPPFEEQDAGEIVSLDGTDTLPPPKKKIRSAASDKDGETGKAPAAATAQSLSGRLTEAEVGQIVQAGMSAFAGCSRLDATVTVYLRVDAEGRVGEALAARSDPDDAKMRDCVAKAFKTLRFPRSTDGKPTPVRFELRLTPTS